MTCGVPEVCGRRTGTAEIRVKGHSRRPDQRSTISSSRVYAAPRATVAVPLLLVEVAMVAAVLVLLAPVLFVRSREPFERMVVILELVLRR